MHVEAQNWSGLCATHYANAHNLSLVSLRRWRDLFDSGEVEIDWRAHLHPSARPKICSGVSSAAKQEAAKEALTDPGRSDPLRGQRSNRRNFTDEEKLVILCEAEQPDVSVAAICRRHDIVTSMVFRWRTQFGFGQKERAKLAAVTVGDGPADVASTPVVLHDLLQPPAGMTAMQLADGRCSRPSAAIQMQFYDMSSNRSHHDDDRSGRRQSAFGARLYRHEKGHGRTGDACSEHAEERPVLRSFVRLPRQEGANRQDPFLGREWIVSFTKRRDRSGFVWPRLVELGGTITLSPAQLAMLIEGIDWRSPERVWKPAIAG
jgi:transposase-like protein